MIDCENVSLQFNRNKRRTRSVVGAFKELFKSGMESSPFWALQDISFKVSKGQALAIIGPNGSGKSTLLKILAGILCPDRGRVKVQGRIFPFLELGTGFEPELSGAENIFMNGIIMKIKKKDLHKRFDKIVEFAELGNVIDTPLKHYSSGMQMRLGFAIAMHGDPEILLIDEIMAVGDEAFQRKCINSIHEFRNKGGTILFVSHAMDHVRQLCDSGLWLDQGEMKQFGAVSDVVDAYQQFTHKKEMLALEAQLAEQKKSETAPAQAEQGPLTPGTHEIEIQDVVFLDENRNPATSFQTNSKMFARISFHAKQKIPSPIFGVAIHHLTGAHICGPNTSMLKATLREVDGDGAIEFCIESLVLLPGTYLFTVGIFDHISHYPFDYRDKAYKFEVDFGPASSGHRGLVAMSYDWNLNPDSKFQLQNSTNMKTM
jgi:lipopolysaccharide transport system ATP-binding protein